MKVSVIIPCFNVEKHIEKAVQSVFDQSYKEIELICVNDGSTDDTLHVLEGLKKNYSDQLIIINQENQGASAARNRGIEIAQGEYLQFLDGDDYLLKDKINHQIDLALKHNSPMIIVGGSKAYNEEGEYLFKREYSAEKKYNLWLKLLETDLGNTCANLFKSDFFRQGGRWNPELKSSQDYNLMFEILKTTEHVIFDSKMNTVLIRRTSNSISHNNKEDNWVRHLNLRSRILTYIKDNKCDVPMDEAYQIVFDAIRILYMQNKNLAFGYFKSLIPKEFTPSISPTTGRIYILFFNVFGFKGAEFFKGLFSKISPKKATYG